MIRTMGVSKVRGEAGVLIVAKFTGAREIENAARRCPYTSNGQPREVLTSCSGRGEALSRLLQFLQKATYIWTGGLKYRTFVYMHILILLDHPDFRLGLRVKLTPWVECARWWSCLQVFDVAMIRLLRPALYT